MVAKLDFSNAFNSLHCDAMLMAIKDNIPELAQFCYLAYLSLFAELWAVQLFCRRKGHNKVILSVHLCFVWRCTSGYLH